MAHAAPPSSSASPAAEARAEPQRFGLVVGSNHSLDPSQAALRFADDDAARMAELLTEVGVDVELVTHLDRDSQAMFPTLVGRAHRPDGAGLDDAYADLLERMRKAKQAGRRVELLIYYSGHGDVGPDGQGYLTLDGDKLTRARLFGDLLSRSPADHNHVVIDACRSEQFVLSRGGETKAGSEASASKEWKPDRAEVDLGRSVQEYLDRHHLGGFPNTGVVLAHSADQQTHEWDRYRGGIFTHELLSGLRGGADLNGDGHIEYSELGAFVSAANHGVEDPRARLEVVVRPPADDERHPVLSHGDLDDQRVLLFGPGDRHHYTVEDARGVRLADVRRSGEQPGYLRLPPGDVFVGRSTSPQDRQEAQIPAGQQGVMVAYGLSYVDAPSAARGSLDQAFRRGLFSTPFGPGYYHGYTSRNGLLAVADASWQGPAEGTATTPVARPLEGPEGTAPGTTDGKSRVVIDEATGTITTDDGTVVIARSEDDEDDEDDDGPGRWRGSRPWGGVFLGVPITPFSPRGGFSPSKERLTANDMEACLVPRSGEACQQVRGLDLRWQLFDVRHKARFPRTLGFFRSGYEAGRTTFERSDGFTSGDATRLTYVAVPLWVGGNLYLFDSFPLRPYAGLGFGLDVIRLDYDRFDASRLVDTVVRPGFELHAGLELRITNYVSLTGEIKQQWSARKKIAGVPDLANEGVTIITGVAIGFPLRPGDR
ncbi:caspase family protein [Paraliomyxa miuraensis]|uniref:caspase family protein n=1 Tax=Paraliomyxa miuraensis TaxID=376150 RepID=UPI002252099D|nr:caspase family protein [Paraliomyxa miuraensis]MCX4244403.1 caspase family protein [Paraliomyxa miuraensis]